MSILPNPFEPTSSTGGHQEAPAETSTVTVAAGPAGPFESRFVLDEEAFLSDLEPLPAFLCAPSQEYLRANDLIPVLAVLAGH